MASNLKSDDLQPKSGDGLQPNSDGLQPASDGLQPESDGLQPTGDGLQPTTFEGNGFFKRLCQREEKESIASCLMMSTFA